MNKYNRNVELFEAPKFCYAHYTDESGHGYIISNFYVGSLLFYKHPHTGNAVEYQELATDGFIGDDPNYTMVWRDGTPITLQRLETHLQTSQHVKATNQLVLVELDVPEGWVQLDDGKFLCPKGYYGKYEPDLLVINKFPELNWERISELNIPTSTVTAVRGKFFKTKKGANAFEVNEGGPHVLLRDSWGGSFNDYKGGELPTNQLYHKRASSNGGGTGYDYAVITCDWINNATINDY